MPTKKRLAANFTIRFSLMHQQQWVGAGVPDKSLIANVDCEDCSKVGTVRPEPDRAPHQWKISRE